MLFLDSCDLNQHTITITPTIPVRRTNRGLPRITFSASPEVIVVEGSCEIELKEGVTPVELKIKAACKQDSTAGLKRIIPQIFHRNSLFWDRTVGLPTIRVCMLILLVHKPDNNVLIFLHSPFLADISKRNE